MYIIKCNHMNWNDLFNPMVNTIEGKGSDCLFPQNVAYAFTKLLTSLSQLLTCLTCTLPSILSFYLTSLGKIPLLLFYYTYLFHTFITWPDTSYCEPFLYILLISKTYWTCQTLCLVFPVYHPRYVAERQLPSLM